MCKKALENATRNILRTEKDVIWMWTGTVGATVATKSAISSAVRVVAVVVRLSVAGLGAQPRTLGHQLWSALSGTGPATVVGAGPGEGLYCGPVGTAPVSR